MTGMLAERLRELGRPNVAWFALAAGGALMAIGVTAMDTVAPELARMQTQRWLPIALTAMFVCMLPEPRTIRSATYPAAVVLLALLVFLILPFVPRSIVPVIDGARRWIDLGVMNFQPSELAKIVFVLAVARYLRYRSNYRSFRGLIVPFALMFVPIALLLKQPDLGIAMLLVPTLFVMLLAAGAKLRHLGTLAAIGALVAAFNVPAVAFELPSSMHMMRPHQTARIAAMLNPERHRDHAGYQQMVSKRIVGAGGVQGLGEERARTILKFNHLPENHNDMIFAVVVNRWGLIGAMTVLGLFVILVGSCVLVASRTREPFARLVCVGLAGQLFAQATINIAVTIGLMPITGMNLPLVSYGGSSLVATFSAMGLVVNFASRPPAFVSRPSFEFDSADAAVT